MSADRCRCRGRSGKRKTLYPNRNRAVSVALSRGWVPTTYRCPCGAGAHLTHDRAR